MRLTLAGLLALALVAALLLPGAAMALTLDEAIAYALKHSEDAEISREQAKETMAKGGQAVAFIWPQVKATGAYTDLDSNAEENKYFPFLNTPDKTMSAGVQGSQVLFAGGRIWRSIELRKNLLGQAGQAEKGGLRNVRAATRRAFYGALFQNATVEVLKDRVQQRRAELKDAQDLRDAGVVTPLDARQANLNLNFGLDALKEGEALAEQALIRLNRTIGAKAGGKLLAPEGEIDKVPDAEKLLAELEGALGKNELLDARTSETRRDGALLEKKIATGGYFPELALVSGIETEGADYNHRDETWSLGVNAAWNIFEGNLTRSKVREAGARLRQAEEGVRKTREELAAQAEAYRVDAKTLAERTALQKEAVTLAEKNYEDARGQYRAGTITLTQLGEFSLTYAEARFNLLRIYYLRQELATGILALLDK
jgi:outer membrane protein TolC